MAPLLRFALPPSLGQANATRRAALLEGYLANALSRDVQVGIGGDYQTMERDLLSGSTMAAWGPPFVCARTEAYGGRGLVRQVRRGSATYRSAIVALKSRDIRLDQPAGLRAVWVDRDSTAGYLLPQAYLRDRGIHAWESFAAEHFAGSYRAALEEVLSGRSDLTAIWASSPGAARSYSGIDELAGPRAAELAVLAYTRDCPNDGVVLSPKADEPTIAALERAFLNMSDDPEGRIILEQVFSAERFEPAPRGSYREMYDLVFASLPGA